ncbi:glycoside hydrolase family 28 protein [Mangrovibacterium diazotrophicum]|uniref:Glycosyl hydrolase family 28 n=1 Tax=Mangrovibacterium diazotrophicum TaxID=1261403 RepID=A0A419W6U0_9BACT|nr:glycoside hydrolase family 28 protein [Mangrovibacterium diazotrophicum]RKD91092.1 glycosyl hydrolase family 28 [Mangrovibacterium diazotrophicum]
MKTSYLIILCLFVFGFSACKSKPLQLDSQEEILARISAPEFPENNFQITDFGATSDSLADCKPAIDKAIQACAEAGGGTVIIPAGIWYVEGPIHFESNINLQIDEGATLRFSSNPASYLPVVATSWEGTLVYNYSPLIYAYGKENIAITGKGTIDGEGSKTFAGWHGQQKPDQLLSRDMNHQNTPVEERIFGEGHFLRPQLVQFYNCKNILVEGVKIEDSPFWCIHLLMCENATLRGLTYDAQNKNNDGIDPEYSRDILIENINFNNNDDNVAVKAGRDDEGRAMQRPSENIIIRNCHFKGLNAVVMGSEMSSGVRNVFVENCDAAGYAQRGIYLKSNPDRGGEISNIFVKNVHLGEVKDCFMVTSNYHNEGTDFPTNIHSIYLENVSCKKAIKYGIYIKGHELKDVHDFVIKDFKVDSAGRGVHVEHAENIRFENVVVNNEEVVWDPVKLLENASTDYDY